VHDSEQDGASIEDSVMPKPLGPLPLIKPARLYKYRALDKYSISTLARHALYCVDVRLFNDPFDCHIGIEDGQGWKPLRVCSLSEVRDDILMWGHYTDSHKGFCLEFDFSQTDPERQHQLSSMCFRVDYRDDYPSESNYHPDYPGAELPMRCVITKSRHWAYEKEWRIVAHTGEPGDSAAELQFYRRTLMGIIFGYRMSNADKKLIRSVASEYKDTRYYQAVKHSKEFRLNIVDAD
jgi:hypothetical protein